MVKAETIELAQSYDSHNEKPRQLFTVSCEIRKKKARPGGLFKFNF